jgi:hypothetical protein
MYVGPSGELLCQTGNEALWIWMGIHMSRRALFYIYIDMTVD